MQKKIIALAIASALTVPALALADSANVTLYGIADVSFDQSKNGNIAGTSGVTVSKVSSNSSRLGLKGSEDLGGGLKAIWQIEQAVAIDGNATSTLGTRNTFAGLAGDAWGSLTMGRNDTPYKSATRGYDVFMDHVADNRALMGQGIAGFDVRFTDTMRYDSPDLSGFKGAISYSAGGESNSVSTSDIKGKAWSMSGTYATGPFSAALAYQKNTFGSMSNLAGNAAFTALGATCAAGTACDEKAWKIGGSYKMDQFGVNAVYEKTTDSLGAAAGGSGHKAYYLAGTFNATANDAIKLAYGKLKNLQDGSLANSGAKQWSLGADHSMSKRTTAYVMYTKIDNDSAQAADLYSGASTAAVSALGNDADPSAFSIGLKHAF